MTVRRVRVGDVLDLARRAVAVTPLGEYREIGVRSFGRGLFHKEPVSGAELGNKRVFEINDGDLVVSNVFAWEGAVAVATEAESGMIGSHRFMTWVPDQDRVDARYAYYYFTSSHGTADLVRASPGSAGRNKTLGIAAFEGLTIPLPSLDEQRAIADRLGSVVGVQQTMIERGKDTSTRLDALRRRTVEDATDGSTNVSAMEVLTLARRAVQVQMSSSYHEIGVRSFGRGLFHKDPVSGGDLGNKRVFHIQAGDLVISNVFAWEGAVAIATANESGMIGSHRFMTWVPDMSRLNPWFAYYYLTSPRGIAQLANASPGSAGRNRTLSIGAFNELQIPLPALEKQEAAVGKLKHLARVARGLEYSKVLTAALPQAARNEVFAALL